MATVIRSVGSASLRTPHTGALRYDPKQPKIPAAAMTAEDAMLLDRLLKKGERVRMHLILTPRTLPDVESANVIAEIRGSEKPEEIVLIGGHLDSWDLGTGAIDDGAGVAMVMETLRLLKEMNLTPKRTIRGVTTTLPPTRSTKSIRRSWRRTPLLLPPWRGSWRTRHKRNAPAEAGAFVDCGDCRD